MKYRVINPFIDRVTKEYCKVDSVIEVSDERAKEIMNAGAYIEAFEPQDDAQADAEPQADAQNDAEPQDDAEPDFESMKLEELKQYVSDNGIALNGARTKAEIIEAIKNAVAE